MYNNLKQQIDEAIHANGMRQSTGTVLNTVLNAIVDTLGAGLLFGGFLTPDSSEPSDTEGKFYLAKGKGLFLGQFSLYSEGVYMLRKVGDNWVVDTLYDGGLVFDLTDGRTGLTAEEFAIVSSNTSPNCSIVVDLGGQQIIFHKTESFSALDYQFSSMPVYTTGAVILYQGILKRRLTQGVHEFEIVTHTINL